MLQPVIRHRQGLVGHENFFSRPPNARISRARVKRSAPAPCRVGPPDWFLSYAFHDPDCLQDLLHLHPDQTGDDTDFPHVLKGMGQAKVHQAFPFGPARIVLDQPSGA